MSDIEKARSLLRLALKHFNAVRGMLDPTYFADEIFGFHAQQAVEMGLKTWLTVSNIEFAPTHDLTRLIELLEAAGEDVSAAVIDLSKYAVFAVQAPYEEAFFSPDEALNRQEVIAEIDDFLGFVEMRIAS